MSGSINKLDTNKISAVTKQIRENVKNFDEIRNEINRATNTLLNSWVGEARNEYEVQYNILNRNIKDLTEELYDLYDALVEAEVAYIETDESLSNEFKNNK